MAFTLSGRDLANEFLTCYLYMLLPFVEVGKVNSLISKHKDMYYERNYTSTLVAEVNVSNRMSLGPQNQVPVRPGMKM